MAGRQNCTSARYGIMEREYGDQDPKLVSAIDDAAQVLQADSKYPEAREIAASGPRNS